jgi:hypothetical protein
MGLLQQTSRTTIKTIKFHKKESSMRYLKTPVRFPKHLIIFPFIFGVAIPIVITDICVEIYHRISFPLCKIPYIKRSSYIKIDRHKLSYLTFLQKIYCAYCGYVNGVMAYWVKIASETEKYWCGIQHKNNDSFIAPKHHANFTEYGNEENCKLKYGLNR